MKKPTLKNDANLFVQVKWDHYNFESQLDLIQTAAKVLQSQRRVGNLQTLLDGNIEKLKNDIKAFRNDEIFDWNSSEIGVLVNYVNDVESQMNCIEQKTNEFIAAHK